MTEEASAGRLYADVLADVSKFRADAERKLKTELKDLKAEAKVKLAFSAAQARTALNTTLRELAKDSGVRSVTASVAFSAVQARAALNATLREVARDEKLNAVKARVEFDSGQVRRALNQALNVAIKDIETGLKTTPLRVSVQADTFQARREIDALTNKRSVVKVDTEANTVTMENQVEQARRRQSGRSIDIPVRADLNTLSQVASALTGLTKMAVIADGAVQLAGGLLAIASSAGQAVGVLAVLPNLAGVAVQGIGALLLGFSGIGAAVKAMGKAQQAAGTQATKSAGQQVAAAEQVRAAQVQLSRAQEQAAERVAQARERLSRVVETAGERAVEAEMRVAEAQVNGARRIQDAERQVTAAHAERQRALDGLRVATELAIEKQQDLTLALSGGALDEEGAQIALERAKARLEQITSAGSTATPLDKREADLAFRQAVQRLKEVQERNGDLAKEKAASDRKGIQGSDEVVAAQQRIIDATNAEAEAQRNLAQTRADVAKDIAKAQYELAKTQRDNARDISDAQKELAKTQRDGARNIADAQRALARAMRPATTAATGQAAAMTALNTALSKLSPAGQKFARFVKDVLEPRFQKLRNAVQDALLPHIQKAITLGMPLLDTLQKGLVGSANRIGGMAEKLGKLFGSKAFSKDVGQIMASNNRALGSFGDALVPLVRILVRVAKVAGPILLEPFAKWTKQLAEAAEKSDRLSESRIAVFLEKSAATAKKLSKIFVNVVKGIVNITRTSQPAGDTLIDDLVAASERFVKVTGDPNNQRKMREFFDRLVPIVEKLGKFLERVGSLLLRIQAIGGGRAFGAFLTTMEVIVGLLEKLVSLPGVGPVVATLLTLAGVGLAFGLVATAIGGIVKNLGKLAKFTGLSKVLQGVTKGFRDMGTEVDKELPKDKKKSDALRDVGDKADTTKRKSGDLGKGFDVLGNKAKTSAKKSRGLAGALQKVGDAGSLLLGGGKDPKTGKKTKGGKLKTAGKGAAGVAGLGALLFGGDILQMLGIDPNSLGGSAAQGAITGGSFGSFLGPIGAAIGAIFGGALGTVKGGGGDIGKAAVGALGGLPGLFVGGFHDKIMEQLKQLALDVQPQVQKIKGFFASLSTTVPALLSQTWETAKRTVPGLNLIPGLTDIFNKVKTKFTDLKTQAPEALRNAWSVALATVPGLRPLVGTVGGIVTSVKARFAEVKTSVTSTLSTAWASVTSAASIGLANARAVISAKLTDIRAAFTNVKNVAVARLREAWTSISTTASAQLANIRTGISAKLTAVGSLFATAKNAITARVREAMDGASSKFKTGLTAMQTAASTILAKVSGAFTTAKDNIGRAWSQVQDKVAAPVRWIGTNVYNRGIKGIWDKVASLVKMPGLPSFPGFSTGGVLPGYTPGRDVMSLPAFAFSGGEAIMRPEWTKAVGTGFVDLMNKLARTGGVKAVRAFLASGMGGGFADGGIVGRFESGGIIGTISGLISAFAKKAKDGFLNGVKNAAGGVLNPIMGALGGAIGGTPWGNLLTRFPPMMVKGFLDWLHSTIEPKLGGDGKGVVKAAASMIGRGDDRGANNNWLTRMWGMPGSPWCAMFVSEAIKQAKATKFYPGYPTAAVYGYYSRMKKVGGDAAKPGDLGVYNGSSGHINVIEKNNGQGRFTTIGGNENAVVRRGTRVGAYAILRPEAAHARGGIIDRRAFKEKNLGWRHDWSDPLIKLLSQLSGPVAARVSKAIGQSDVLLNRDSGGPLYPGTNNVLNGTSGLEWVLTPQAVAMLGGPKAVQSINVAARLHRSGRSGAATTVERRERDSSLTQHIYPQRGQSEHEIAMVSARKIGAMLRR